MRFKIMIRHITFQYGKKEFIIVAPDAEMAQQIFKIDHPEYDNSEYKVSIEKLSEVI